MALHMLSGEHVQSTSVCVYVYVCVCVCVCVVENWDTGFFVQYFQMCYRKWFTNGLQLTSDHTCSVYNILIHLCDLWLRISRSFHKHHKVRHECVFVPPSRGARGAAQPGGAAGEGQVWGRGGSVQGNSQQMPPLLHIMCTM